MSQDPKIITDIIKSVIHHELAHAKWNTYSEKQRKDWIEEVLKHESVTEYADSFKKEMKSFSEVYDEINLRDNMIQELQYSLKHKKGWKDTPYDPSYFKSVIKLQEGLKDHLGYDVKKLDLFGNESHSEFMAAINSDQIYKMYNKETVKKLKIAHKRIFGNEPNKNASLKKALCPISRKDRKLIDMNLVENQYLYNNEDKWLRKLPNPVSPLSTYDKTKSTGLNSTNF